MLDCILSLSKFAVDVGDGMDIDADGGLRLFGEGDQLVNGDAENYWESGPFDCAGGEFILDGFTGSVGDSAGQIGKRLLLLGYGNGFCPFDGIYAVLGYFAFSGDETFRLASGE